MDIGPSSPLGGTLGCKEHIIHWSFEQRCFGLSFSFFAHAWAMDFFIDITNIWECCDGRLFSF